MYRIFLFFTILIMTFGCADKDSGTVEEKSDPSQEMISDGALQANQDSGDSIEVLVDVQQAESFIYEATSEERILKETTSVIAQDKLSEEKVPNLVISSIDQTPDKVSAPIASPSLPVAPLEGSAVDSSPLVDSNVKVDSASNTSKLNNVVAEDVVSIQDEVVESNPALSTSIEISQPPVRKLSTFSGALGSGSPSLIVNGENIFTSENVAVFGLDLLANDEDASGSDLFIQKYSQSKAGGVVEQSKDGRFNYFPPAYFYGEDWFDYVVSNDAGASNTGRVKIIVSSVDEFPMARPDVVTLERYSEKQIDVLANDSGLGDGVVLSIGGAPMHGALSIINGKFLYTPLYSYVGNDSFIYKITDIDGDVSISTVTIIIECVVDCASIVQLSLSWAPSPSSDVIGYNLYVGYTPNEFFDVIHTGSSTQFDYTLNNKGDFYFAVSAINSLSAESELSQIVKMTF